MCGRQVSLTLFSIVGALWPHYRFFLRCMKTVCSRDMIFGLLVSTHWASENVILSHLAPTRCYGNVIIKWCLRLIQRKLQKNHQFQHDITL